MNFDLEIVKSFWNINGELNFVRQVANWVYFSPSTDSYIRITNENHRSKKQIESEIQWMSHVNNFELNTVRVIPSSQGNQIETIEHKNKKFHLINLTRAKGTRQMLRNEDSEFFKKWGETTAKLHLAAKKYSPKNVESRPIWSDDSIHKDILNIRKPSDGEIYKKSLEIENLISSLPRDSESFGLIHSDLHTGNFNVDEKQNITLFDFDDSVYSWFIYDIAVIFWSFQFSEIQEHEAKIEFLKGYSSKNTLNSIWFERLENFYAYRVIQIYYFALKEIEKSNFNENVIQKFKHSLISTYSYFKFESRNKRFELNF